MVFRYPGGEIAVLWCAVATDTPHEAIIAGSKGMIRMPRAWWKPERVIVSRPGESDQVIDVPHAGNGYNYEAAEVARCLEAGLLESPMMPLDETLSIMRTMDTVRAQIGLVYPQESAG
jgi:hypothetical protein